MGDRRDHFESQKELWDLFRSIMEQRKKRELDPTLSLLRDCVLDADKDKKTPDEIKQRINEMLVFLEMLTDWYEQMSKIPQPMLIKMLKMGSKITSMLSKR